MKLITKGQRIQIFSISWGVSWCYGNYCCFAFDTLSRMLIYAKLNVSESFIHHIIYSFSRCKDSNLRIDLAS